MRTVRAVFAALADPAEVTAHRPGALERVHLAMSDGRDTRERLADAGARMVAVLDDLQLTGLVTTSPAPRPGHLARSGPRCRTTR